MADFEERTPRPLILLYGSLQTKDSRAFLRHFSGLAIDIAALPVTGEQSGRAPGDIEAIARELGFKAQAAASVEVALRELAKRDWPTSPRILICGSLYLAGEVLAADGASPE